MVERDENEEFVRIRCDSCEQPAPPTSDLIINHGLNGMGWQCSGGTHYCPTCKSEPIALAAE